MLCFSCLFSVQVVSCNASTLSFLPGPAGGFCVAEQTTPASRSTESHRSQSAVIPTLFVLGALCLAACLFSRRIKEDNQHLTFWKRFVEPNINKFGSISTKTFIPYLFATHGL